MPPFSRSVSSVPNILRFSSASNVPGTDTAYDDLLEPISTPPLSSAKLCVRYHRPKERKESATRAPATGGQARLGGDQKGNLMITCKKARISSERSTASGGALVREVQPAEEPAENPTKER